MYVSNVTVYTLRGPDADGKGQGNGTTHKECKSNSDASSKPSSRVRQRLEKLTGGRGDEGQDGDRIVETGDGERDWRRGEVGRGGASHRPEGAAMER